MTHHTPIVIAPIICRSLLVAGLVLAACGPGVATPMPEPPSFLKGDLVSPAPVEIRAVSTIDYTDFLGAPGSAPPGAIVYLTNLDSQNQVVATQVQADGSFTIGSTIQSGDELRFIVVNRGTESAPFDARYDSAVAQLIVSRRFDCLSIEPGPILQFQALSAPPELTINNSCLMPVALENPRFRVGLSDYLLDGNILPNVAVGTSAVIPIQFSPKQAGAREDVLFFDAVLGGTRVRYAVTLFGE